MIATVKTGDARRFVLPRHIGFVVFYKEGHGYNVGEGGGENGSKCYVKE